ncbi:uncharacterized protein LOC141674478 [Apium graveolens]|uniref:uncharacterized protein LOC141674478 n=1 Tax=Apium graveolens TaxID=4045 RepID=UPI003D7BF0D9
MLGESPKFCHLYVYDTENEIENRKRAVPDSDSTDSDIVKGLLLMLDENNRLVNSFRMARDWFKNNEPEEVELELVSCKATDGRSNNVGPSNEVGALIVGLTPHLSDRLWQQYIVDVFTAVKRYRLEWIKWNQKTIQSDLYNSICDSLRKGDSDTTYQRKNVILPATFTGSQRYMSQYFKDSLDICHSIDHPSFFLTMTCNTKWPEIQSMLQYMHGVNVTDAPDVVVRVFKMKLDQLVDLIKNQNYSGRCTRQQIDDLVCAEIPHKETDLAGYNVVKNYMIHGPCGHDFSYSSCMSDGKYGRHFPKRYNGHTFFDDCGFPVYQRRRMDRTAEKNNYNDDTKEKGLPLNSEKGKTIDEVRHFLDGHDVCASEASWRLLGYDIHYRYPSIERLSVHVEGGKNVTFNVNETLEEVANKASNRKIADPLKLWTDNWKFLSNDILYNKRKKSGNVELKLSDVDLENYTLVEVEKLLNGVGKSIKDFPNMPYPEDIYTHSTTNRLIEEETGYDKNQQFEEHSKNFQSLISEQLEVYNSVLEAVNKGEGGKIVLPRASSGIAVTLLSGGRISHSRFHIPLKLDRYSVAVHPRNKNIPFGGITVVFGGNFRQILHVIPKASRTEIVQSSVNQSSLWNHCKVFVFHQNMRLGCGKNAEENQKITEFAKWVLDVGDGKVQNIHPDNIYKDPEIIIPRKYLVEKKTNTVKYIVDITYPDFTKNYPTESYLKERAILTPINAIVDEVNSHVLNLIPGITHSYLSQDSIDTETGNDDIDYESSFPIEYLNSINMPSIRKHDLKLKVGDVVMLMRNLNQIMGLYNGTRMVLTKCLKNNVKCQLFTGSHAGTKSKSRYLEAKHMEPKMVKNILRGHGISVLDIDLLNHSQNMFYQLSALNTSSTTGRVKVRVTRMWPSLSSTDMLKTYNLILLDAHDSHVQTFVYAKNWQAISSILVEGGVYVISNFHVREALGSLRPTHSRIMIQFSQLRTIEKIDVDDFMIPLHKFEIDIIGVVEDFERVKSIKTIYGEKDIVKFRITDERFSYMVSVWAAMAKDIDRLYGQVMEEPIIAIVTSTKMNIFKE